MTKFNYDNRIEKKKKKLKCAVPEYFIHKQNKHRQLVKCSLINNVQYQQHIHNKSKKINKSLSR